MIAKRTSHTLSDKNVISAKEAVRKGYPMLAKCGLVWIPTVASAEGEEFELCEKCHQPKGVAQRGGEPHYVYRHFDAEGRLVYVGCTINPVARTLSHRAGSWWFDQVVRTRLIVFPSRNHALMAESKAIAEEHPRFNVKGRWEHRSLWTAEDYLDYYTALGSTGKSTDYKTRQLAKVAVEAERRYGIDLAEDAA